MSHSKGGRSGSSGRPPHQGRGGHGDQEVPSRPFSMPRGLAEYYGIRLPEPSPGEVQRRQSPLHQGWRPPPGYLEYYGITSKASASADPAAAPATPASAASPPEGQPSAVQAQMSAASPEREAEPIHEAAALGTSGPSGPLPYIDIIQRSFGRHDVGHIKAHADTPAAEGAKAMGAEAFATGEHVAFAGTPSLHTAAHEAAHVVQQRGGVQLAGGVGREGDAYERHADAVADAVVAGHSAEALLDGMAGGAGGRAVQRQPTPLTPVEQALDGRIPWTQALAEQALTVYAGLSPAARQSWLTRWSPRGQIGAMLHALARADVSVGGRFEAPLRDLLQRTQRAGALASAHTSGLASEAAMAQRQANFMYARNRASAAAAQPVGGPPPSQAQIAAQQQAQVEQTSIPIQTQTLTPQREAQLTTQANAAVAAFVTWCAGAHPDLHITASHFRVAVREVFDRGEAIIAFADQGGAPRCVVGEAFAQAAGANPAYALPTVVHELWGHNEYGPYGDPGTEYGLELYDRAAARMPGYTQPTGQGRTSEVDAYAYQETEIYSLLREVEYYTPNAPQHQTALANINYDPAPAIADRIGLIKQQWEPRLARAMVRGLYQRFRIDPRLVPAALTAFQNGVRQNFPPAEATAILR